jgi:hypothetical protein
MVFGLIQMMNSSFPAKDKGYLSLKEILINDYFMNLVN